MSGTLAEGYTRQLECVSGYQPTSDQDLYCGPAGVIEGPTCVEIVQCDLGVLANTDFTAGDVLNDGDSWTGDFCAPGYEPSSADPPYCDGGTLTGATCVESTAVQCDLGVLANSDFTAGDVLNDGDSWTGDSFFCAPGYEPSSADPPYCDGGTLTGATCVESTAVQCDLGALENTDFTAGEALIDGDYRPLTCAQGYQPSEEYAQLNCDGGTLLTAPQGATCVQIPTVGSSNIKEGYYALGKQTVCESFAKEQLCKLDGSDQTACADSTYPEGYLNWVGDLAAVAAGMMTSNENDGCGVHDPTTCEQSGDCLYGTNNAKCVLKPSWVRSVLDGEGAMIWIATAYENGHAWCGTAMNQEACDALGNACAYLPDQGGCQKNYLAMVVNLADACSDHVSSADLDAIADFRGFTNVADARAACGEDCPIIEEGSTAVQCDLGALENTNFTAGEALNDGDYRTLTCAQGYQPSEEHAELNCDGGTLLTAPQGATCVASTPDAHAPGPDGVHEEPSSWVDDGVDKAPEGACCAELYESPFASVARAVSVTTCISDANPLVAGADYFDANNRLTRDGVRRGAADIEFANEFSVHYERYYKVVKTSCNNIQASWDCVPKTYVLRMCGSTAPTSYADGTPFPSGTQHFSVPLQGVATALSPALSFIELLGKRDTLKQVSTGSGFYSPCIQQLEEAGSIRGLNEYGLSEETAWRAAIAADSTVDGVFTDSWDPDGDNYNYIDCADNCGTGATDTDLDIVFDAASDSGGPLGRAEWIKYIALFFNEEDRANAYHKREVEAWTKYSNLAAAEAAGVSARTCAWVNSGWSGRSASFTTYKTDYCTAAGLTAVTDAADLALATPTYTTTYADAAAFKAALATFDVIVDESYLSGGTSKADVLSNLGVAESDLKTGAILLRVDRHKSDTVVHADSVAARSSEDWFESGVTRPALVLHDLLFHVWPDAFTEPAAGCSRFFRDVLADETITEHGGAHCDTWSAADEEGRCLTNTIKDTDPYLAANAAPYDSELDQEGTKGYYETKCATGLNGAFSFRRSIGHYSLSDEEFDCVSFRFADMDACKSANPHDADALLWISEGCEKEAPAAYVPPTNDVACAEWATESVCYSKETEDECAKVAGQSCKWNPGQGCWLDEGAKLYSLWYRPFGLENFGRESSACVANENDAACAAADPPCSYNVDFGTCFPAEERAIATLSDDGVTGALAKYFSLYAHPCYAHADEESCLADAEKNGCTDRTVVEGVHPDGKSFGDFSHCMPKKSILGAEAVNACVGTDVDFTAVGVAMGFGSLDELFADAGVERVYPSPPPLSAAEQDRIKAQEAEEAAAAARAAARAAAKAAAEAKEAMDTEGAYFREEYEKLMDSDPKPAKKCEMLGDAVASGKKVQKMAASGVSAASDDDACDQVTAKLPDPDCECTFCDASAASRRRRRSALQTSYDVEVLVDPDEVSEEEVSAAAEAMRRDLPGVTVDTSDADIAAEIASVATAIDGDATWIIEFADMVATYTEASATAAELASTAETLESIADEAAAALIFPPPPFAPPPPPSPPPRALIWDDEDAAPPRRSPASAAATAACVAAAALLLAR